MLTESLNSGPTAMERATPRFANTTHEELPMSENPASDFKSVDALAAHLEKLVYGWASVIHCKAKQFGGPACDRVIMIVFRDFYQPPPDENFGEWTSSKEMLCRDCARDLTFIE